MMDRRRRTDWTGVLLLKVSNQELMSISCAAVPISRGRIMGDWKPRHRSRSAPEVREKEKGDRLCAPCRGLTKMLTGSAFIPPTSSRSAPALPLLSHRPKTDSDVDTCLVSVFEPKSDPGSDNRASQTTVTRPTLPIDTTEYRLNVILSRSINRNAIVGRRVIFLEYSCKTSIVQGNHLGCSLCELLLDLLCKENLDGDWLYMQRVSQSGLLRTRWHFNDVGVITDLEIRYSHESPLYLDSINFNIPLKVFANKCELIDLAIWMKSPNYELQTIQESQGGSLLPTVVCFLRA